MLVWLETNGIFEHDQHFVNVSFSILVTANPHFSRGILGRDLLKLFDHAPRNRHHRALGIENFVADSGELVTQLQAHLLTRLRQGRAEAYYAIHYVLQLGRREFFVHGNAEVFPGNLFGVFKLRPAVIFVSRLLRHK